MSQWQRFKTTRVYLHPPKAERLITLWREGKVMLGEIEVPINRPYESLSAAGVWFVDKNGVPVDFKVSEYRLREDGIPVHTLVGALGEFNIELECLCDYSRRPSASIKATLRAANGSASGKIGFMLRRGRECDLIFSPPDVYAIYEPRIDSWKKFESDWTMDGIWRSGEYFFACDEAASFEFDENNGLAFADIKLFEGESRSFIFTLGKGEYIPQSYDEIKENTISEWTSELERINKLPEAIVRDGARLREIKNLTVQLLQCFCYGVDCDKLYSRQGGLQRRVWTYEAMPVLEALERIGDFADYIEPVIDAYFTEFYTESGEIVPLGIHWAMATGTVLNSFGKYAVKRGRAFFNKYRDRALKSYEWMKETRAKKTYDGAVAQNSENSLKENYLCIDGLFPPMSCCDNPLIFQAWLSTDCNNIMGLDAFAKALEYFGDERADEVRGEYLSYKKVISSAWDNLKAEAGDTDELKVPYTPLGDHDEVTKRYSFQPSMGFLMDALDMPKEDYEKIISYYTRRGIFKGGLYNKMPEKDPSIPGVLISEIAAVGYGFIWYVCAQEYGWFNCMLRQGDIDRCTEIISDARKYAMSDEYYMIERYHQKDPWYAPWSPNASCNGRMINMALDIEKYGER